MARLQRALSEDQKQQRRDALVDAARGLVARQDYESVSMAEVARRAKVSKGTVYVYFASKEALFLELCLRELRGFFAVFQEGLAALEAPAGVDGVVAAVQAAFASSDCFLELVGLIHVLEQNADKPSASAFRTNLLPLVAEPARELERHLPFTHPGEGARLILSVHAMAVGFQQVTEPCSALDQLRKKAGMAPLDMAFPDSVLQSLRWMFMGMQADRAMTQAAQRKRRRSA